MGGHSQQAQGQLPLPWESNTQKCAKTRGGNDSKKPNQKDETELTCGSGEWSTKKECAHLGSEQKVFLGKPDPSSQTKTTFQILKKNDPNSKKKQPQTHPQTKENPRKTMKHPSKPQNTLQKP